MNRKLWALLLIVLSVCNINIRAEQAKPDTDEKDTRAQVIPVYDLSTAGEPIYTPNGEIIYELTGRGIPGTSVKHSLAYVILPPGKSTPNHYHPKDEESYYILKGKGHMNVGGQDFEVEAGQAVYIAPGKNHKLTTLGEDQLEFIAISAPAWYPDGSVYLEE